MKKNETNKTREWRVTYVGKQDEIPTVLPMIFYKGYGNEYQQAV